MRAAVQAGERVDADAVRLLIALSPGDPQIPLAIDLLGDEPDSLALHAREAAARLQQAMAMRDEAAAREIVTALEHEVLAAYRPSHGLGRFEDDVAVALAMLAAYEAGADETHLMMAEELMLGVIRRDWDRRMQYGLAANCEAAMALTALAALGGKPEYRARALDVLNAYAATYRSHGTKAAPFVYALRMIS
jgi:uncharacterized protein YyaL (SSP411 family)